jgi:Gpi18-like mannosyltransferase
MKPISIIKIKSIIDETFLEIALLFRIQMEMQTIKNDKHEKIRSYRYWVKCYAFINSQYC